MEGTVRLQRCLRMQAAEIVGCRDLWAAESAGCGDCWLRCLETVPQDSRAERALVFGGGVIISFIRKPILGAISTHESLNN